MIIESARAWIHRGDKHEAGRIVNGIFGAGYGDMTVFERLTHHFEHLTGKFRELIEKKHSVVGKGNLSRNRVCATTN